FSVRSERNQVVSVSIFRYIDEIVSKTVFWDFSVFYISIWIVVFTLSSCGFLSKGIKTLVREWIETAIEFKLIQKSSHLFHLDFSGVHLCTVKLTNEVGRD